MLQACEGLAHAHALRIVHRDVKPSNLFVLDGPPPRELKVLDFGISRMTTYEAYENQGKTETVTVTDSAQLLGSPQYTSPGAAPEPPASTSAPTSGRSAYQCIMHLRASSRSRAARWRTSSWRSCRSRSAAPARERGVTMTAVVQKCLTRSLDERFRR